ncbi:50S ribosomal protein L29 [Candidatus Woesearchaeota archaeon]|nr:50S ribosomal protein L29 [Candidatus Woesearchaeota archaeon]
MKFEELKKMDQEKLKTKILDLRKELIILNSKRARGTTLEKPALIKNTKKTIAKILTILNSKQGKIQKTQEVAKNND